MSIIISDKEIEEGNIALLKYMGLEIVYIKNEPCFYYVHRPSEITPVKSHALYHRSWSELMPVVVKIITEKSSSFSLDAPGYAADESEEYYCDMLPDKTTGRGRRGSSALIAVWRTAVATVNVLEAFKTKQQ